MERYSCISAGALDEILSRLCGLVKLRFENNLPGSTLFNHVNSPLDDFWPQRICDVLVRHTGNTLRRLSLTYNIPQESQGREAYVQSLRGFTVLEDIEITENLLYVSNLGQPPSEIALQPLVSFFPDSVQYIRYDWWQTEFAKKEFRSKMAQLFKDYQREHGKSLDEVEDRLTTAVAPTTEVEGTRTTLGVQTQILPHLECLTLARAQSAILEIPFKAGPFQMSREDCRERKNPIRNQRRARTTLRDMLEFVDNSLEHVPGIE